MRTEKGKIRTVNCYFCSDLNYAAMIKKVCSDAL